MKIMNCKTARREIDEIFPNGNLNGDIRAHLESCGDCGELYKSQSHLQQIMGTLETVNVPNDFDFRLHARLRKPQPAILGWWMKATSVALGAALCLLIAFLVGPGVFVKRTEPAVAEGTRLPSTAETVVPSAPVERAGLNPDEVFASTPVVGRTRANNPRHQLASIKTGRRAQSAVMEFSSEGASHITGPIVIRESPAFPIDAPAQGLRLSLDDGRGNARTISFPTVSFGSQRVLSNANQLQSKGIW